MAASEHQRWHLQQSEIMHRSFILGPVGNVLWPPSIWLGATFAIIKVYPVAAVWYRRAARFGNANAQGVIGAYYMQGVGLAQDYSKGLSWLRKGAAQGDETALFNLGVAYALGKGVQQDYVKAHRLFSESAGVRPTGLGDSNYPAQARAALKTLERKMNADQLVQARTLSREQAFGE